jgi:phosphohistidine phosphatase
MELILLRHGKSPSLVEAGVTRDEDRPLAEVGRHQAKRAGKALAELDSRPDLVLVSPLLRARQTAEQAVKGMGKEPESKIFEPLASGADPEQLIEALSPFTNKKSLMLVGHQPDLGALASRLLFGSVSSAISLKPGGMLLLETDRLSGDGAAELRWLLLPSQIECLS